MKRILDAERGLNVKKRVITYTGLICTSIIVLLGCTGQNDSVNKGIVAEDTQIGSNGRGYLKFDTLMHDFGTLIEGEQVVCYFDYSNSGEGDVIIESVESTCGCTVADWSGEPLTPGGKASIRVMFDTSNRSGEQMKGIIIRSTAQNAEVRLKIKANIVES